MAAERSTGASHDVTHGGASRPPIQARIAGAPISWGVCEVPGWGHQLTPERVLTEMSSLGLCATEYGPTGFLAADPAARVRQLRSYGLTAVGGFLPLVLHDPSHDPLPQADRFIAVCVASGAAVMVLAASSGAEGYDASPALDDAGWRTLLCNLDRIDDRARAQGITASVHPHVGTMVERLSDVERVLSGSHIGLCADTGHLEVGGMDAVALTTANAGRVSHVHLKDVDATMAARVADGHLGFSDAVREGIFRPLGQGDVDIASLVGALESTGYQGWYVLEQDVMLAEEPADEGPMGSVRESLDFLLGAVA